MSMKARSTPPASIAAVNTDNDHISVDLTVTSRDDMKDPLQQRNVYGTNGNNPGDEWIFKIYFFPKGKPVPSIPCAVDSSKTVILFMACCQLEAVDGLLKDPTGVSGIYYDPTTSNGPWGDIEFKFGGDPLSPAPVTCPPQVDIDVDCYVLHICQGITDEPKTNLAGQSMGLIQLCNTHSPWQFWIAFSPDGSTPHTARQSGAVISDFRDWSEFKTIREMLRGGNVHVTYKDATLGGPLVEITNKG